MIYQTSLKNGSLYVPQKGQSVCPSKRNDQIENVPQKGLTKMSPKKNDLNVPQKGMTRMSYKKG